MSVTGTRAFGHPQVVEYQAYVTRESSHFLRHAPSAFGFEHADGETTKPSEIFRTVVIIVPIDHVVATLDGPVAAVDPQNALRSGLFRRAAGEAVTDFERTLTALFVRAVPLDDERLAHMRKIEIAVQFCGEIFRVSIRPWSAGVVSTKCGWRRS